MQLQDASNQSGGTPLFVADGTITTGGTSQRILANSISRSYLFIQNLSTAALYVEIGGARATATLTLGAVTSMTVTNGGFGYTRVPQVMFYGGGNEGNASFVASGQFGYPVPAHPAMARAVLTGGVVTSFVIDDPGTLYAATPTVFLQSDPLDPHGVADPHFSSSNSGYLLNPQGGNLEFNGTTCPTYAVSIWGATTGQAFTCRWIP